MADRKSFSSIWDSASPGSRTSSVRIHTRVESESRAMNVAAVRRQLTGGLRNSVVAGSARRALSPSVWLTQLEIAELFATTKQNVSLHIKNVLDEGELPAASVVKDSLTTAGDGKTYKTKCFNLPMDRAARTGGMR